MIALVFTFLSSHLTAGGLCVVEEKEVGIGVSFLLGIETF